MFDMRATTAQRGCLREGCSDQSISPTQLLCALDGPIVKDPGDHLPNTFLFPGPHSADAVLPYSKQQQVATQLAKTNGAKKSTYMQWAIVSLLMQARADEALAGTMLRPLLARMIDKFAHECTLESDDGSWSHD